MFEHALLLSDGKWVRKDFNKALTLLRDAADQGLADANVKLADMYLNGLHLSKDVPVAIKRYRTAAAKGNVSALLALCDADPQRAANYVSQLAKQDKFLGLVKEADLLEKRAKPDAAKAAELRVLAKSAQYATDQYNYATALATGSGCLINFRAAFEWWQIAADNKSVDAMLQLATRYDEGRGTDENPRLATEWFKKAKEAGSAAGAYGYGVALRTGRGVSGHDYGEALEVFQFAANEGDPRAWVDLGFMYENAQGTSADPAKALEYYGRAAEANCAAGLYQLGRHYMDGTLELERNLAKAMEYLEQARELGFSGAKDLLDQIEKTV
jgi:TPR repeat protein